MQSKISEVLSHNYVQIYLSKEELEKQETKELIEKYKKQKYKVGIFVTGKENYPEVLNKIVTKQVELSDNVCEHSNLIYKWFIKYINKMKIYELTRFERSYILWITK